MKAGLSEALRRRLRSPNDRTELYADLLVRHAEDIRATKAEWAAATLTDVEALDTGGVRLEPGTPTDAEYTTSNAFLTALYPTSAPWRVLLWEIDNTVGPLARLSAVTLHLSRNAAGSGADFDGDFGVALYTIGRYRTLNGVIDLWEPVLLAEALTVAASQMSTDTEDVTFTFPEPVPIGSLGTPSLDADSGAPRLDFLGRVVIAVPLVYAGTNANYGLAYNSGGNINETVTGGTLRHRELTFAPAPRPAWWQMSDSVTGMIRGGFHIHAYPATGSAVFDGADIVTLGANAEGEIEFVVRGETPPGTTLTAYAREGAPDPWVEIHDGDSPADVGLAIPSPVEYEMKFELEANAAGDTSPTGRQLGILDRTAHVLNDARTKLARFSGFEQQVIDVTTGECPVARGSCFILRDGLRDYRDLATAILSTRDPVDLQVRVFRGHEDVDRADWLHLNTFLVEDYRSTVTEHELLCVDVKDRLLGEYPQPAGQLFGYILKAATAHITAGSHVADFNRELSVDEESSPGSIVVTVAGSATEESRGVTSAGVPSMPIWPRGTWTIKVEVTAANANLHLSVAAVMMTTLGADSHVSPFSAEQTLSSTGVKVFTLTNVVWPAGLASNVLAIIYRFRNSNGGSQAVTISTGDVNSEVIPPWVPIDELAPAELSGTVADVYEAWRDDVVGLDERYQGDLPTSTEDVAKAVADQDGLRELTRIAMVATPQAGVVIASQGRVHFRSLYGAKVVQLEHMPLVPWEETSNGDAVSPGLDGRVPQFDVPYKHSHDQGDEFAEIWRERHTAAVTAYGLAKIRRRDLALETETAKYVHTAGHAQRIAMPIVQALAWGETIFDLRSTISYPEADVCDPAGFEVEGYVRRNPITDEPMYGRMWVVGVIVGILPGASGHALDGDHFLVWIRNPTDFFRTTGSATRRQMFELPAVEIDVQSHPNQPQNAIVRLRAFPDDADVYWMFHDGSVVTPPRDDPRWTLWDGEPVTVLRDETDPWVFSAFGRYKGFQGQQYWRPVAADEAPEILMLSAAEGGSGPSSYTVTITAVVDERVRELLWFHVVHGSNWPTDDNTETGPITTATNFKERKGVKGQSIGRATAGGAVAGGLTYTITGLSSAQRVAVIAIPVDHTGYVRPFPNDQRATIAHTVTGTATGQLTAIDWTLDRIGTSCAVLRRYDIAWTPDANVTDSFEVRVYARVNGGGRELIGTQLSPDSVPSLANLEVAAWESGDVSDPDITVDLEFELYDGSAVLVQSGPIGMQDFFDGELCPL